MGFLARLFGTETGAPPVPRRSVGSEDEHALERYRYLLRTAPPETIEQVHAEAFGKLTDVQRAVIYEELSRGAATGEGPRSSEPATLARAATRAEMRRSGSMEGILGGSAFAPGGIGTSIAGSLLGTVAGYVVGSALVSAFLPWDGGWGGGGDASGEDAADTDLGFDGFGI